MKALIDATKRLNRALAPCEFSAPWVYRPLEHAWRPHRAYIERFATGPKRVLFMGMNPGPFGMVQTGVPFGEVSMVRDWMGIDEAVERPASEHPKRPVDGFACQRSEVSGRRLWSMFAERFGTAEAFFKHHYVLNFCPLVWMTETGANITPDKLPKAEMEPVEDACIAHLAEVVGLLKPRFLVGVGAFAEQRLQRVVDEHGIDARVGRVLHPSPASPAANRGWPDVAIQQLTALGVW